MKRIVMLALTLMVAALFLACGDDVTSTTAPSVSSTDVGVTGLASTRSEGSGSEGEDPGDDPSDDDDSDDSSDDPRDDDDSDDSSDDPSDDDDSNEGSSGSDGAGDRVRGLFFGIESCPADSGCVVAVRIKDTLVIVTEETRVDNEPGLVEDLPPAELPALLGDRFGLPLRASGVSSGDGLVASKFRIDDEIRATGMVVAPDAGCDVSLLVRGSISLCFVLSPGLSAPPAGVEVRIEGLVPMDLTSPFRATEIERVDD